MFFFLVILLRITIVDRIVHVGHSLCILIRRDLQNAL